jgi:hypothetical protein
LAISVIAPTAGDASELDATWGAAAAEAAVLTAVAAAVLGTALMALIIAPPPRRARRPTPSPGQLSLRVGLLLIGAAAGFFTLHVGGYY